MRLSLPAVNREIPPADAETIPDRDARTIAGYVPNTICRTIIYDCTLEHAGIEKEEP